MKKATTLVLTALAWAALALISFAQSSTPGASDAAALREEVRELKAELVQQEVEFREWKVQELERELQQVKGEKQKLEGQMSAIQQEVATLSGGGFGESKEAEGLKDRLAGRDLTQVQNKLQPLADRELELTGLLDKEQKSLAQLQARLARLKNER